MKSNDLSFDPSRRQFMVSSGAFTIAVTFTGCAGLATQPAAPSVTAKPNAWVTQASDGTVTLASPASEMGQGSFTALPLLLADRKSVV